MEIVVQHRISEIQTAMQKIDHRGHTTNPGNEFLTCELSKPEENQSAAQDCHFEIHSSLVATSTGVSISDSTLQGSVLKIGASKFPINKQGSGTEIRAAPPNNGSEGYGTEIRAAPPNSGSAQGTNSKIQTSTLPGVSETQATEQPDCLGDDVTQPSRSEVQTEYGGCVICAAVGTVPAGNQQVVQDSSLVKQNIVQENRSEFQTLCCASSKSKSTACSWSHKHSRPALCEKQAVVEIMCASTCNHSSLNAANGDCYLGIGEQSTTNKDNCLDVELGTANEDSSLNTHLRNLPRLLVVLQRCDSKVVNDITCGCCRLETNRPASSEPKICSNKNRPAHHSTKRTYLSESGKTVHSKNLASRKKMHVNGKRIEKSRNSQKGLHSKARRSGNNSKNKQASNNSKQLNKIRWDGKRPSRAGLNISLAGELSSKHQLKVKQKNLDLAQMYFNLRSFDKKNVLRYKPKDFPPDFTSENMSKLKKKATNTKIKYILPPESPPFDPTLPYVEVDRDVIVDCDMENAKNVFIFEPTEPAITLSTMSKQKRKVTRQHKVARKLSTEEFVSQVPHKSVTSTRSGCDQAHICCQKTAAPKCDVSTQWEDPSLCPVDQSATTAVTSTFIKPTLATGQNIFNFSDQPTQNVGGNKSLAQCSGQFTEITEVCFCALPQTLDSKFQSVEINQGCGTVPSQTNSLLSGECNLPAASHVGHRHLQAQTWGAISGIHYPQDSVGAIIQVESDADVTGRADSDMTQHPGTRLQKTTAAVMHLNNPKIRRENYAAISETSRTKRAWKSSSNDKLPNDVVIVIDDSTPDEAFDQDCVYIE